MSTRATSQDSLKVDSWLYRPRFPEHWERKPLYSLANWVNGLAFRNIGFSPTGMAVIKIAEIKNGITDQTKFTQEEFEESVRIVPGDMLFSWSGQPESSIDVSWWHGPEGWLNQHIFRVTPDPCVDDEFFYYLLRHLKPNFVGIARNKQTTGLGHVTKKDLEEMEVAFPALPEQKSIAHVLGTLDDKIELNRRMNRNLEEMARAIFQDWFVDFGPTRAKMEGLDPYLPSELWNLFPDELVDSELGEIPEGWETKSLDEIATFLNGLALQKYPPNEGPSLPVIKIAQLRAGHTQGADSASVDVPSKYHIHDGDILFSWSGSLELDIWTGGEGALNQHLFKVDSDLYPKWLYYRWVREHLQVFRAIAADKTTTMGHIQRRHLSESHTVLPDFVTLEAMNRHMRPLLDRSTALRIASRTLAWQRETLLPQIMSGNISINLMGDA